jgi:hypothetical protein
MRKPEEQAKLNLHAENEILIRERVKISRAKHRSLQDEAAEGGELFAQH